MGRFYGGAWVPGGPRDLVQSPGNAVSWAQTLSLRVPMSRSCREEEGGTGEGGGAREGALHPAGSVRTPRALEVMLAFQFPFTFKMEVYLFIFELEVKAT